MFSSRSNLITRIFKCYSNLLNNNNSMTKHLGTKINIKTNNISIDLNEFNDVYEQARRKAINDLFNDKPNVSTLNEVKNRLKSVIDYNVGTGKRNRARICWLAYRHLSKSMAINAQQNLEIGMLGFCLEMMQSYFLIYDDIMDDSLTRRGKTCWYRKENVGMIAINDGLMISSLIHLLLKKNLSNNPSYNHFVDLFNQVTLYTSYGQCLDLLSFSPQSSSSSSSSLSLSLCENRFANYTTERYDAIVQFKTAYYTFSLPIRLAIYLAGITDSTTHEQAEEILLEIGHFFQTQDDYLDCYGDVDVTGKIGTDIQDGKCSWLFIQALNLANEQQRLELIKHYGNKSSQESEEIVKNLYQQLSLKQLFENYEHDKYREICTKIESISDNNLPKDLFHMVLTMIYKRKQ